MKIPTIQQIFPKTFASMELHDLERQEYTINEEIQNLKDSLLDRYIQKKDYSQDPYKNESLEEMKLKLAKIKDKIYFLRKKFFPDS